MRQQAYAHKEDKGQRILYPTATALLPLVELLCSLRGQVKSKFIQKVTAKDSIAEALWLNFQQSESYLKVRLSERI